MVWPAVGKYRLQVAPGSPLPAVSAVVTGVFTGSGSFVLDKAPVMVEFSLMPDTSVIPVAAVAVGPPLSLPGAMLETLEFSF
jgi:hypothetical protein